MPPPAVSAAMSGCLRVLIIDEHEVTRSALSALLRTEGLHVVADVPDVRRGVAAAQALAPDLVLLDLVPGDDQTRAAVHPLRALPSRPRLVLTSSSDRARLHRLPDGVPFLAKADICARTLVDATARSG